MATASGTSLFSSIQLSFFEENYFLAAQVTTCSSVNATFVSD